MNHALFNSIQGIHVIYARDPRWPNPANIYIIPDDAGFSLIDVGYGGDGNMIHLLTGLEFFGLNIKNVHTIVLSHAHPDHMGAMWWVLEEVNPEILIHPFDVDSGLDPENLTKAFDIPLASKYMPAPDMDGKSIDFDILMFFQEFGCIMSPARKTVEVEDGEILHMGDFAFEVLHTPGHSPGHISLFERKKGILFSGDLIGKAPTWYTPSSGGLTDYLESLSKNPIPWCQVDPSIPRSHYRKSLDRDPSNTRRAAEKREALAGGPEQGAEIFSRAG